MRHSSTILFMAASSSLVSASVIPPQPETKNLQARGDYGTGNGLSAKDAQWINIDCSKAPAHCNINCYGILCRGEPNPVTYSGGDSARHREESGFSSRLYRAADAVRRTWGIFIRDQVLVVTGRSAEESVMANTRQAGNGEHIYPTVATENSLIGTLVGGQIKHYKIDQDRWYFKWFTNYGVGAPLNDYCHALQSGRKNNWETYDDRPGNLDHSICFGTADETDPARTGT
ncbi:hypothetical protein BDW02DRAFT_255958 [Decorospora gaudefroyi]|uniref:Ecp2 effector protein domain-containing protein n=1 Tax=Decorospora gaudefroyi TaxID=184978 RepID=A0A6A5K247_9PLEO|nr:hypothetical protein BDW02DRAFT_255958 [Decorospora gaudefroyi]